MQFFKAKRRTRNPNRCKVWVFGPDGKLESGMSENSLANLAKGAKVRHDNAMAAHQRRGQQAMALFRQGQNKSQVARSLGISRNYLYRALAAYNPDKRDPLLD